jgi:hypothetical protein
MKTIDKIMIAINTTLVIQNRQSLKILENKLLQILKQSYEQSQITNRKAN